MSPVIIASSVYMNYIHPYKQYIHTFIVLMSLRIVSQESYHDKNSSIEKTLLFCRPEFDISIIKHFDYYYLHLYWYIQHNMRVFTFTIECTLAVNTTRDSMLSTLASRSNTTTTCAG